MPVVVVALLVRFGTMAARRSVVAMVVPTLMVRVLLVVP